MRDARLCPIRLIANVINEKIDPACVRESCQWWRSDIVNRDGLAIRLSVPTGCGLINNR